MNSLCQIKIIKLFILFACIFKNLNLNKKRFIKSKFKNMINSHRLPNNVIPVNYDLELEPDLKDFIFKGRVTIDVDVTNCLILK
jgi:hypothetical protein